MKRNQVRMMKKLGIKLQIFKIWKIDNNKNKKKISTNLDLLKIIRKRSVYLLRNNKKWM